MGDVKSERQRERRSGAFESCFGTFSVIFPRHLGQFKKFDALLTSGAGSLGILMAKLQRDELSAAISFKFGVLASGFHPRDPA